ncbi:MAG: putative zinc-binding protein [Desulfobaccales bacterium]
MSQACCGAKVTTMMLACAGCSNVGQLSNQAAVELTREGFGKLACLAAIGAHLNGFVKAARDIPRLVVIDGCEVACAKKVLEQAEVPVRGHVIITELDIKKNPNLNLVREDLDRVKAAVRDAAETGQQTAAAPQAGGGEISAPASSQSCGCAPTT